MNFNLAKMLVLIAVILIFAQIILAATPVSLTIWEATAPIPTAKTFAWNDPKLNQVLPMALSSWSFDFKGVSSGAVAEFYDVYRSLSSGAAAPWGECFAITGQWNGTGPGFNISRVDINMSDGSTQYYGTVGSFKMGTSAGVAGSEADAVDPSLLTATKFGYAVGHNFMRLVVCEPKNFPLDTCCPPWNPAKLAEVMVYKPAGLNNYTLSFQPSNFFKVEMQSYIEHLNALEPTITMIIIDWALYDQGAGNVPMGWAGGSSPGSNGTQIGPNYFRTWQANGASTSFEPINPSPAFFPGGPMQKNTWYMIHTGIYLNNNKKFFAGSCANNDIYVRLTDKKGGSKFFEVRDVNNNLLN